MIHAHASAVRPGTLVLAHTAGYAWHGDRAQTTFTIFRTRLLPRHTKNNTFDLCVRVRVRVRASVATATHHGLLGLHGHGLRE